MFSKSSRGRGGGGYGLMGGGGSWLEGGGMQRVTNGGGSVRFGKGERAGV